MGDTIWDGTSLPETKSNARPVTGTTTTKLTADDFNTLRDFVSDLRDNAKLEDGAVSDLAEDDCIRLRNNGGELEHSVDGKPYARLQGIVDVRRFGVDTVANGVTNCDTALAALRTHAQAYPGTTYFFPPGTYQYKNSHWMRGIRKARFLAYGCIWKNVLDSSETAEGGLALYTLNINQDLSRDRINTYVAAGGNAGEFYPTPHLIQSCDPAQPFIRMSTAAEVSNYSVGDWILISGYCRQDGGAPISPGFFEYQKIAAINTTLGVIRLEDNLRFGYDSRWYPNTWQASTGAYCGPAQIIKLTNRSQTSGGVTRTFDIAEQIIIEGVQFADNADYESATGWMPGTAYTVGQRVRANRYVYTCTVGGTSSNSGTGPSHTSGTATDGSVTWSVTNSDTGRDFTGGYGNIDLSSCLYVKLVGCKIGSASPTQCRVVVYEDCDLGYVEVDKLLESVTFERCRIRQLGGGTGCQVLTLRDCEIFETFQVAAQTLYVHNTGIYCDTSRNGNGAALAAAAASATFDAPRFYRHDLTDSGRLVSTAHDFTSSTTRDDYQLTVLASPAPSLTQIAVNLNVNGGKKWRTSTAYTPGQRVVSYNGRVYDCATGGTSAASGSGPSGDTNGVTDGTVVWNYVGHGYALEPMASLMPGARIWTGDIHSNSATDGKMPKHGTVKNVYRDSGTDTVIIEADFDVLPVAGDVFQYRPIRNVVVNNPVDAFASTPLRPMVGTKMGAVDRYVSNFEQQRVRTYVLDLSRTDDVSVDVNGYIKAVTFNIVAGGTRAAGTYRSGLSFYNGGSVVEWAVNAKLTGIRKMDPTAGSRFDTCGDNLADYNATLNGTQLKWVSTLNYGKIEPAPGSVDTPCRGFAIVEVVDHE